jgi:hypothetical protein
MVSDYNYEEARNVCEKIAASFDVPRFYREKAREVEQSRRFYEHHHHVQACVAILQENESYGHGLSHARKVAIDSGAIILIEGTNGATESFLHRRVLLAHLAGVLHDIKRSSPNHAREGAQEAYSILRSFDLEETERKAISQAIENHEAFQPHQPLDTIVNQLLSDALYDADKFRWGPDNFTEMIWDIIIPRQVPLSTVLARFTHGLKAMERIRETFRTATGREYGPDFIDLGLGIGKQLYVELNSET